MADEADMAQLLKTLKQVKRLIPPLSPSFHKGQAGRTLVIGGSENYTGAPYYACMSSMLLGADMGHILCDNEAGSVIKSYSPDLIVFPILRQSNDQSSEQSDVDAMMDKVTPLFDRMSSVSLGPGLGRDALMQKTAAAIVQTLKERKMPLVIDADGLWLIKNEPNLVQGYLECVLTPNVVEFGRLAEAAGLKEAMKKESKEKQCLLLSKTLGVTIVQKGPKDYISNGKETLVVDMPGGLKRCGGQGDVLSGTMGTFLSWQAAYRAGLWEEDTEDHMDAERCMLLAAFGACATTRFCSRHAFDTKGRGMMATDLVASVGDAYKALFDSPEEQVQRILGDRDAKI
ncbi:Ribokinase-like protein [Protomyces lactucae-debilis]|uniref:ATP-dependent (S)-NAD(P)H-hydrate dehydratase n=1 Tax=Protomyces lactucae-debilis TaxID=2754530 RepID=A0A1Y2FFB2_PROLT|nr:Ribokinase-like protein [Protomyces lactucae-debilis]ORY81976.1 Ribokinase-like protein [Protomyces lactucae-debilis]